MDMRQSWMGNSVGESGQKMMKISKKRTGPVCITIKLLSNKGHSSLVGLQAIILFSPLGTPIKI